MAKRPNHGHDATQELTLDQLVSSLPAKPPALPSVSKNDTSQWGGLVVGTDDFSPKAGATKRRARWPLLLALVVLAAGGGAAYVVMTSDDGAATVSSSAAQSAVQSTPTKAMPEAPTPADPKPPGAKAAAITSGAQMIDPEKPAVPTTGATPANAVDAAKPVDAITAAAGSTPSIATTTKPASPVTKKPTTVKKKTVATKKPAAKKPAAKKPVVKKPTTTRR